VAFGINGFWIVISALNFVVVIAAVYAVIRVARWFSVRRRRETAELADLRQRVSLLEAADDRSPEESPNPGA
jgi:hypothetical protein